MNREELLKMAESTFATCIETLKKKNHDYSGGGGPFDNFSASEIFGIPKEKGILLRIMDKMMRIKTYLDKGELKVVNESVLDAIDDNINYLVLLRGMIVSRNGHPTVLTHDLVERRIGKYMDCVGCNWKGNHFGVCNECQPSTTNNGMTTPTHFSNHKPSTKGEHNG